ncbi:MAG: hypothetical protein GC192_08080 [Bacteroidetes bacterium]|nr:hypothetical protein [Bacteroidota bacterium]
MKLQIILPLCLLATLLLFACNRKTTPPTTPTPLTTDVTTSKPDDTRPEIEPKTEAYQVAGFQKTACFGKCPVYQVKFYSDGKVTWYGQMNVERKGWHEAKVDDKILAEIRAKAHAANYWDLASKYPEGQKVADLPSTVTFIRTGDMEKTVIDTYQGPAELVTFEDYLESLINGLRWQPTQGN